MGESLSAAVQGALSVSGGGAPLSAAGEGPASPAAAGTAAAGEGGMGAPAAAAEEEKEEEAELDAEVVAHLRRCGVSEATERLLGACSVGLEALTLCSAAELVDLAGEI